jgi:hypothetical protein
VALRPGFGRVCLYRLELAWVGIAYGAVHAPSRATGHRLFTPRSVGCPSSGRLTFPKAENGPFLYSVVPSSGVGLQWVGPIQAAAAANDAPAREPIAGDLSR